MTERSAFARTDQSVAPTDAEPSQLNLLSISECTAETMRSSKFCLENSKIIRTNPMASDAPPQESANNLPLLQITDNEIPPNLGAGDSHQQISADGAKREFELHVPKDYDGKSPVPVVYMFNGITENMDMMREYSQMNAEADKKGFAVVYMQADRQPFPNSLGIFNERSWNLDHGTLTPKDPTYDDLDYVKRVKSTIESEIDIDKSREYLAGFSEGGEAVSYIAQRVPHTFAGIASVHGTIIDTDPRPEKSDATPFISILGNDDAILPIEGGRGLLLTPVVMAATSAPELQAPAWANADGDISSRDERTGDSITTYYTGGSAPVEQIIRLKHDGPNGSIGGSHAWDGGNNGLKGEPNPDFVEWISRPVRQSDPDFDASQAVADFLLQNSLQNQP